MTALQAPSSWAHATIERLWCYRKSLAVVALGLTAAAAFAARQVTVDNSLAAWFVDDSAAVQDYHRFLGTFGSDDLAVVALERGEGFASVAGTQVLRAASRALGELSEVTAAFSFVQVTDLATQMPSLMLADTLEDLEQPEERLNFLLSDPLIKNRLLSADGKTALILLRLQMSQSLAVQRDSFVEELDLALAAVDARHFTAGMSVIYAALNKLTRSESPRLLGIALLLMSLILLLSLRQLVPVVVALTATSLAVVWTFGYLGYAGGSINVLTSVVPTVILVIGISTSVHIFSHLRSLPPDLSPTDRIVRGLAFMLPPCAFAAATTAAGFASLTMADLPMTQALGQLLAFGIAAVFVLVISISVFAGSGRQTQSMNSAGLPKVGAWLARVGTRRPRLVVLTFALVAAGASFGATRVNVDAFPLELFPAEHPIRVDANRIEAAVGPYTTLEFTLSTNDEVLQLHHLQAADQWARSVVAAGHAVWNVSLLDGIKRAHELRSGEALFEESRLPATQRELGRILKYKSKLARDGLQAWYNPPHQLRYTFGVRAQGSRALRSKLNAILALAPTEALEVKAAGLMPLWLTQASVLVETQIQSFAVALLLVMGMIVLMLRRTDLVILAAVVNLLPVLTTFGLMGVAGIRLDLGTVAVASVILGLVIDDTIHFLHRLKHELAAENDILLAVGRAADSTGQAIVITSVVVSVGFGILGFAQVTSVAWFGLLIGVATITALLADLLLAPALLTLTNRPRP